MSRPSHMNTPVHGRQTLVQLLRLILVLLFLSVGPGLSARAQTASHTHIVHIDDTLASIAAQYGTPITTIRILNDLSETDTLYVGQVLKVSASSSNSPSTIASNASRQTGCSLIRVVQSGENLSAIAARYNVSVAAIAQASGILDYDTIWVGQQLCVPGTSGLATSAPAPHTPTPTVSPTESATRTYTVLRGDTLFAIALAHGISVDSLMNANGITDPRTLRPGQVLQIPGATSLDTVTPARPPAAVTATETFILHFFNNLSLSGEPVLTREEAPGIRHEWGLGAPGPGVNSDNFSALLDGQFTFVEGMYRFSMTVDDGMRLFIDDVLVKEAWHDQPATTYEVDVPLTAGHPSRAPGILRTRHLCYPRNTLGSVVT